MTVPTLDFAEFQRRSHDLAVQRRAAEASLREAVEAASEAEGIYRREVSKRFATHRSEDKGVGESDTLARGDVSHLSRDRDLQAGMVTVYKERLRGLEGDRATLRVLADWSQRVDPGVGG